MPSSRGFTSLYVSERVPQSHGSSEDTAVLPGDWDLVLQLGVRVRKSDLIFTPHLDPDVIPVVITRNGKLVLKTAASQLVESGRPYRLCITGRHPAWISFRSALQAYIDHGEHIIGCSYSPLTHPDFAGTPAWVGESRYEAIARYMAERASVMDLGAHLGYMCERLEDDGHSCLGVEQDPDYYYFLSRLKEAQDYQYQSMCADACEAVQTQGGRWHTVLALALFHHFVKTKEEHEKLEELLSNLRCEQLFFWASNPAEKQMSAAYRNYEPEQFADFVRNGARLRHAQPIGVFRDRVLFHIWR